MLWVCRRWSGNRGKEFGEGCRLLKVDQRRNCVLSKDLNGNLCEQKGGPRMMNIKLGLEEMLVNMI